MMNFSSFTPLFFLLFLPGFLFGLAITIPRLSSDFESNYKKLLMIFAYMLLWILSTFLMTGLQIISNSINDKLPYIIAGVVSGVSLAILFEIQFGFKNRILGMLSIVLLSVLACLIFDYYYPMPNDKELHIGMQILIWNVLIGLGLTVNNKQALTAAKKNGGFSGN